MRRAERACPRAGADESRQAVFVYVVDGSLSRRSRVHHTVRLSSHCVIGAGVLLVPTEDETLDPFTVVFGPAAERRTWSGRGRAQEADLRKKHAEYLRETLPKFNRLRKGDARSTHAEAPSPSR